MIRIALTAALIAVAVPAFAATGRPLLKASVTVTGDYVRIGDLVENAGDAADVRIFRSPDLGTVGTVPVAQVLRAIGPHNLVDVDTGSLTAIEVARDGHAISSDEIKARIAAVLAGQNGLGDASNLAVTLDRDTTPIVVAAATASDLRPLRSNFDPHYGRFDIVFEAPSSSGRRSLLRYTGGVIETRDTVVASRSVGRGDTIKGSDVAIERRNKADLPADAIGTIDHAVGLAARQQLRTGQPLRRSDVMKPEIVRRDDNVALVLQTPGILLTTRGKALESGTDGDVINVLNIQSKRTVRGTVSGPGRVTVILDSARVVSDGAAFTPTPAPAPAPQKLAVRNSPE